MKAIELEGVAFSYGRGKPRILDGIWLSCESGTVNALIGLNGCGKTTLIKVMAGLETPSAGTVKYSGKSIFDMTIRERASILSYVSQNYRSLGDYLVRDYILFGTANRIDVFDMPGREERRVAEEVLERFGMSRLADRKLGELSGGERQIVSICSAIVQDSDVVILDEPCSALDIPNQAKVLSTLEGIAENDGKTVLFSTHNPNHALHTDANVLLLGSGAIIDHGPACEVVTPDRLKPVYGDRICLSRDQPFDEISFCRIRSQTTRSE